ncbi:unnamed protein product [Effrenium voratum]|uniref:Uncharacterized protein n=1 Tax=Effrenium voratum TaxID=2562239 RepID=A0AA36IKF2_9DINO|nr:unnamed protein product [Effrenium voratum]
MMPNQAAGRSWRRQGEQKAAAAIEVRTASSSRARRLAVAAAFATPMPHKKGRARDVVPHREHPASKKASAAKGPEPFPAPKRATLEVAMELGWKLPAELWLRQMMQKEQTLWQKLCNLHFPSMYLSVCGAALESTQPESTDWKMLFARRWQKQRLWDRRRTFCTAFARCVLCGELGEEGKDGEASCHSHPGDFLPRADDFATGATAGAPTSGDWTRAELQQLQTYARAAWRSIGNATIRSAGTARFRGGGYWAKGLGFKGWGSKGHWAEGLGARPGNLNLRLAIDGHVPCAWACCGANELITEGCTKGAHRFR